MTDTNNDRERPFDYTPVAMQRSALDMLYKVARLRPGESLTMGARLFEDSFMRGEIERISERNAIEFKIDPNDRGYTVTCVKRSNADDDRRSPLRRADINKMTPAELAIRNAMIEVEKLPANPKLTNAVTRLASAAKHVADYVDINPTLDISQPARIGIGAIVRLNSGGPNMLVTYPSQTETDGWICEYIGPLRGLARRTFAEPMLTLLLPDPPEFIDRDKQGEAEELGRRAGFYESSMHDSVLAAPAYVERANPFQHGNDSGRDYRLHLHDRRAEHEPPDMAAERERLKRENKVITDGAAGSGIGSAATPASLLGIATTLKPAEEVLIAYADIEHAFPQWTLPLPEIAPSEQFRSALAKLPGTYSLDFYKHDHWANDPANNQPQGDGQWRLTRLIATPRDMEELLREFSAEGHGSRRLVQVMRSVLWHATKGKFPDLNEGGLMRRRTSGDEI